MADYNSVILVGRLTRDPELKYTSGGGTPFAKFAIAVGRSYKGQDGQWKKETSFIDIVVFGRQAENCAQYLHKGSSVLISGELEQQRWEDRSTGQKRSKLVVRCQKAQFLDPKNAAPAETEAAPVESEFTPDGTEPADESM